jgi:hypothetical protein
MGRLCIAEARTGPDATLSSVRGNDARRMRSMPDGSTDCAADGVTAVHAIRQTIHAEKRRMLVRTVLAMFHSIPESPAR